MKTTTCLFVIICFAVNAICQSNSTSSWAIIDNDFETIALANSFYEDENGFVAGGTAGGDPLLLLFVFNDFFICNNVFMYSCSNSASNPV